MSLDLCLFLWLFPAIYLATASTLTFLFRFIHEKPLEPSKSPQDYQTPPAAALPAAAPPAAGSSRSSTLPSAGSSRFSRSSTSLPPVSILKPLKGKSPLLFESLSTFCIQDYPEFEIHLAIEDEGDPAAEEARRLQEAFPHLPITLCIPEKEARPLRGPNRKVNLLSLMMEKAKHDFLMVSDQDIKVGPRYIREVISPFLYSSESEKIGLVTCPYKVTGKTLPSKASIPQIIEALHVNCDFIPSILVARSLYKTAFGLGATLAIRRQALQEIGGFDSLASYLADDYQMGIKVRKAGYEVVLSRYLVEHTLPPLSWKEVWEHQLRWGRTYRVCNPVGWFFSILTNLTFFATLSWLSSLLRLVPPIAKGSAPIAKQFPFMELFPLYVLILMAFAFLELRIFTGYGAWQAITGSRLRLKEFACTLPFLIPKDLWNLAIWVASFGGNRITWGGRHFRVKLDGTMSELE